MTSAYWTPEEEARLVRGLRDGLTIDDLAAAHQRTPTAILARAARMTPEETAHLKREQRVEWLREQLLTDRDYDWAAALATTRRRQHAEVLALAPHTGAIWTPAEDDQVRAAIHAGTTTGELAAQLQRSRKSTARRVRDLRQQDTSPYDDTKGPPTTSTGEPAAEVAVAANRSPGASPRPVQAVPPHVEGVPAVTAATGSAHGQPWADEETFVLLEELRRGVSLEEVATAHGRSIRAIDGRAATILTRLTGRKHGLPGATELLRTSLTQDTNIGARTEATPGSLPLLTSTPAGHANAGAEPGAASGAMKERPVT